MYSEISNNKLKTWILMLAFIVLAGLVAFIFSLYYGEPAITPYVLIGMAVYTLIVYWSSSKMAMAMNGAHQIEKKDNPRLWRTVENLAITNGMPMPKIYLIDDPAPNAFATGRDPNHAIVGATTGLVEMMDDNELEGVMAHELGHVKNYDIRVSMIAFGLVAVIALLADIILRMMWFGGSNRREGGGHPAFLIIGILAAILAPIIATVIQLAISRKREFLADASGALTTRYPQGLASALEKIGQYGSTLRRQHTATAHLFFANPLKGKGKSFKKFFSTHPPVEERVKRLRGMGEHA